MLKGALISKGMTAEVYEWGSDRVLKLYFEQFGDDWINSEAEIGHIIHKAGLPSPAVFDIIKEYNRKGIIFQRISGKSILNHIEVNPWKLYYYSQQLAGLHYNIHKHSADKLPSQKEKLSFAITKSSNILGEKVKKIINYIESLPDGINICHGDLHFDNIIVSNNKLAVIDWASAYKGDPLSDVARTSIMMISPTVPPGTSDIMAIASQYTKWSAYCTYISEYMRLSNAKFKDVDAWILPVAAARLKDNIDGEEKWLMNIIDRRLAQLDK